MWRSYTNSSEKFAPNILFACVSSTADPNRYYYFGSLQIIIISRVQIYLIHNKHTTPKEIQLIWPPK